MKNPPSASVRPPIHTTQRVPIVSSKPRSGCGNGGGGTAGGVVAASFDVSTAVVVVAGAMDSASGRIGGGSGTIPGEARGEVRSNACVGGNGGGTGLARAIWLASIASPHRRHTATVASAHRRT